MWIGEEPNRRSMKSKTFGINAVISFLISLPALAMANDLPRLSPERYCDEVAKVSGGSAMIRNGCIDMEQDAYNKIKGIWEALPRQTQRYCTEVAQVAGGSYAILSGCVDMEVEAAGERKNFKY